MMSQLDGGPAMELFSLIMILFLYHCFQCTETLRQGFVEKNMLKSIC